MDQLLQQLAQTLKIPTDALQTVLSNYPKLRQEYVIYHSLYCVRAVAVFTICFTLCALFITAYLACCQNETDKSIPKATINALKIEAWTFILAILLTTILSILMGIFAPDITIIKEIVNQ
jgi:hypothetical protein